MRNLFERMGSELKSRLDYDRKNLPSLVESIEADLKKNIIVSDLRAETFWRLVQAGPTGREWDYRPSVVIGMFEEL